MGHDDELKKIIGHVEACFGQKDISGLYFHNLDQTKYVVNAATEIAGHYQLDADEQFQLFAAAWLLYVGFVEYGNENAAFHSARLAEEFFSRLEPDKVSFGKISALILAAELSYRPSNLLEEIIQDANSFYIGKSSFMKRNLLLKKEAEYFAGSAISDDEWDRQLAKRLEGHKFNTEFCRLELQEQKEANLRALRDSLLEKEESDHQHKTSDDKQKRAKRITGDNEKSVETLFTLATSNIQQLSSMGDNKAHILITVNSIIVSAIISLILRRLAENNYLMIPSFELLITSVTSMIFAILATRPGVPKRAFTQLDDDYRNSDLVFLDFFHKIHIENYFKEMHKMMEDREFLYETLIQFVFTQNSILKRKYRLLRDAYNIFMIGLVIAVIAFLVTSFIHNQTSNIVEVK